MSRIAALRRHLEGWQLAVVAVGTALGGAALAVPRPIAPTELPLPVVDRLEEASAAAADAERIRVAKAAPLSFLVRAAGEALRRFGDAEVKGDEQEADAQRFAFTKRIEAARAERGDAPVLALRAVQADLFVNALRARNLTELRELGGTFFGARDGGAADRAASLQDDELRSLFVMRWTKLAGVAGTRPFSASLNELRLYYRTLLAHAELASRTLREDPSARATALARAIDALSKLDPDYPKLLGLGVAEHWRGQYDEAEALFSAYLETHRTGPWRLRAQGYLLAARQHLPGDEARE